MLTIGAPEDELLELLESILLDDELSILDEELELDELDDDVLSMLLEDLELTLVYPSELEELSDVDDVLE